jgi:TonB family protein
MKLHRFSLPLLAAFVAVAASSPLSASSQDPKALSQAAPVYPGAMQYANREGAVLVAFTITADGHVTDAIVVSSTRREFEAPTLAAVAQWKFTPGTRDGVAVSTPARQLVTFMHSSHDVPATTARLVAKLRVRNPSAMIASAWQADLSSAVVRVAASGTTLSTPNP